MSGETRLELLRARARRVQLVVGLGFLAFILGSLISAFLVYALESSVRAIPWTWLRATCATVLSQLWALLFLPLFSFVLGRALEVPPWWTPLGMAGTGLFFLVCLSYVTQGTQGFTDTHPAVWTTRLLCTGFGVWLGQSAILRGRTRAETASRRAAAMAARNAAEYAEIKEASEKLAARHDAAETPDPDNGRAP